LREFWHKYGSVHNERPEATKGHKQKLMLLNFAAPVSVEFVGFRKTYDVSVTGKFENFVADGFVVHNSRNAASSRAIPIKKMILAVRNEPAMPIFWGKNQSGMAARSEISRQAQELAIEEWQRALLNALAAAERLSESDIDLHKQLVNRLLEPFAWITVIITATEWANFFTQRCHPDAQPEIQTIANEMLAAFRQSQPVPVSIGAWHLPLIQEDERSLPTEMLKKISVARCARVSYLTHDGKRDPQKDAELYDKLVEGGANGHWSPFEHVATPLQSSDEFVGNLRGWRQLRKFFSEENSTAFPDEFEPATLRSPGGSM